WAALEGLVFGADLPPKLKEAMDLTKKDYFAEDYIATRDKLLAQALAGTTPEMNTEQWTVFTVSRLADILGVAEAGLEAAKEHAAASHQSAQFGLIAQLVLLLGAVAVGAGAMT